MNDFGTPSPEMIDRTMDLAEEAANITRTAVVDGECYINVADVNTFLGLMAEEVLFAARAFLAEGSEVGIVRAGGMSSVIVPLAATYRLIADRHEMDKGL